MRMGLGDEILGLGRRTCATTRGAWSLELADLLVRASTRRGLWTLFVALVADGALTLVEAWALIRGHWWGPWLVVVATGSLLPFEVVALVRHPHLSRVVLLALNVAHRGATWRARRCASTGSGRRRCHTAGSPGR